MTPTVVALAGRRIDAADAPHRRFPLGHAGVVRERIRELLVRRGAIALVSSAACGADLLALEAAGELGVRRVVVLPFAADRFRQESVVDRPGGEGLWGKTFDEVLHDLPPSDLIVVDGSGDAAEAFSAANARIVQEAARVARSANAEPIAVIVWDGVPRGPDDVTAHFASMAQDRGVTVEEIATLH